MLDNVISYSILQFLLKVIKNGIKLQVSKHSGVMHL